MENVNNNTNTILNDIKRLIGILPEDESFDIEILININNAIDTLWELGVIQKPYIRVDKNTEWIQLLGENPQELDMIKTYIYLKVKLVFDPPLNSSLLESLKETIRETEYRLNIAYDPEKK